MLGYIIIVIGIGILIFGKQFFGSFLQFLYFITTILIVYSLLQGNFGYGGYREIIYLIVSLLAGIVASSLARGLIAVLFFWTVLVALYTSLLSMLSFTLTWIAVPLSMLGTVLLIYELFFSRISFVFYALFLSSIGAALTLFGFYAAQSNATTAISAFRSPDTTFLITLILLVVIGTTLQLLQYNYRKTPRSSHLYWGL